MPKNIVLEARGGYEVALVAVGPVRTDLKQRIAFLVRRLKDIYRDLDLRLTEPRGIRQILGLSLGRCQ